jgi:flagellar assembly protein FliH
LDALIHSTSLLPGRRQLGVMRAVSPLPGQSERDTPSNDAARLPTATDQTERAAIEARAAAAAAAAQAAQLAQLRATIYAEFESSAQAQLAQALEEAKRSGFQTGLEAGRAAAAAETSRADAERQECVDRLLKELAACSELACATLQRLSTDVAFAAICRIAGAGATTHAFASGVVHQVLTEVRAAVADASGATVRLHPSDAGWFTGGAEPEHIRLGGLDALVVADSTLKRGDCLVETTHGSWDASLDTQLKLLHALLAQPKAPDSPSQGLSI